MIEIRGLDKALNCLGEVCSNEKVQQALEKACLLVERSAKQKAPKDNGDLRRSIKHRIEGEEGIIYTNLEYAPYVEYGTGLFAENGGRSDVPWFYKDEEGEGHITSGQHPQPYMRPALDENRAKIIRILAEAMKND